MKFGNRITQLKTRAGNIQRKRSNKSRARKCEAHVPKDYPWLMLSSVLQDCRLVEPDLAADYDSLERIIRSRNVDDLMRWSSQHGLQSMTELLGPQDITRCLILRQLGTLIQKFPFMGNSQHRKEVAIEEFLQCEYDCAAFNNLHYRRLLNEDGSPSRMLRDMQDFCFAVLGLFDTDQIKAWCRHGPGTTSATSRGQVSSYFKFSQWPYHVTAGAASCARSLIQSDERWIGALEESYRSRYNIPRYAILDQDVFWKTVFHIVPGNRITTVPKDYRKDRPIAIEPTMNMMLQLGVDGHIRRRLKRWGVDLDSQYRNQFMAKSGSVGLSGEKPATLDLSNASDSLSVALVRMVLPYDWFEYVMSIRSPVGELPNGKLLVYEKISSMGNGFTFALESLVFAAIAYASSRRIKGRFLRREISIYGDDIIVPEYLANETSWYLTLCGFKINRDKSFLSGNIKESCGTDWIHGRNVRPVYLRQYPKYVDELFSARNRLHRWFRQHFYADTPSIDASILKWVPPEYKILVGPYSDTEFDGYWHSREVPPQKGWSFVFRSMVRQSTKFRANELSFRKLMTQLHQTACPDRAQNDLVPNALLKAGYSPLSLKPYGALSDGGKPLSSASTCFNVSNSQSWKHCTVIRRTPFWQDEYSQPDAL